SFGQGSNSIKSAEQGAGAGIPIPKKLVDLHGGGFTLTSKLRIGTEVIVTFTAERVVAATPPLSERGPPISSAAEPDVSSPRKSRVGRRPLVRAGTECFSLATIARLPSCVRCLWSRSTRL